MCNIKSVLAMNSEGVDWRSFFKGANASIFDVISHAISIASEDHKKEFMVRRSQIVEKLYSNNCDKCNGQKELPRNQINNVVDVLTEKTTIKEDLNANIHEVYQIKEILRKGDESGILLLESLKRLNSMDLSLEIIKNSEIEKLVYGLRNHKSGQIKQLACELLKAWDIKLNGCLDTNGQTKSERILVDSIPSSVGEEFGLPVPPLDEEFLSFQFPMDISLSGFFDGIDDDGNVLIDLEIEPSSANTKCQSQNLIKEDNIVVMDNKLPQLIKEKSVYEQPIGTKLSDKDGMVLQKSKHQIPKPNRSRGICLLDSEIASSSSVRKRRSLNNHQEIRDAKRIRDVENDRKFQEWNARLIKHDINASNISSYKNQGPVVALVDHQRYNKLLFGNNNQEKLDSSRRKLKKDYQNLDQARMIKTIDLNDVPKPEASSRRMNTRQKNRTWQYTDYRRS